jgi:hypothetical protein
MPQTSTGPRRRRFRLTSVRGVRRELVALYSAARSGEVEWEHASKGANILFILARLIESGLFEERIQQIEHAVAASRGSGYRLDGHFKLIEDARP